MLPTKKGIMLKVPEWRELVSVKDEVTEAVGSGTEFAHDLAEMRRVRVQEYNGTSDNSLA